MALLMAAGRERERKGRVPEPPTGPHLLRPPPALSTVLDRTKLSRMCLQGTKCQVHPVFTYSKLQLYFLLRLHRYTHIHINKNKKNKPLHI